MQDSCELAGLPNTVATAGFLPRNTGQGDIPWFVLFVLYTQVVLNKAALTQTARPPNFLGNSQCATRPFDKCPSS